MYRRRLIDENRWRASRLSFAAPAGPKNAVLMVGRLRTLDMLKRLKYSVSYTSYSIGATTAPLGFANFASSGALSLNRTFENSRVASDSPSTFSFFQT